MAKKRKQLCTNKARTRGNTVQSNRDGVDTEAEDASASDGRFVLGCWQTYTKRGVFFPIGCFFLRCINFRLFLIIFCIALISGKTHSKQLFSCMKFLLCPTMVISPLLLFLNNDNQCHQKIRQQNNVIPSLYHNKIQRCLLEHPMKLKPRPKSQ